MRGMIVRDMCTTPSNWRSAVSVPEYLRAHGIVAIEGVDTRALVRHLRDNGSKKMCIRDSADLVQARYSD